MSVAHTRVSVCLLACCLLGLFVPFPLGYTYTDRLAARPGMYQIAVPDEVAQGSAIPRPRRTVVVVLDGLGYQEALGMRAEQRLQEQGQCWKTYVGSLPMSRPVYAVLSTGVEQDRGGALTNDATAPHRAESIWEIARAAGWSVAAVSELTWWQDLFPRGFARYVTLPRSVDYFRTAPPADLTLIHPLYIDETGHSEGAGSLAYRAAVERADRELQELLSTLDLKRDLILVTADHGHSLGGGHGGQQDRVAHVLSCFAGVGVHKAQKGGSLGALQMTSLGPSLAALLGLHFPAGMRAGDDDLDTLFKVLDPQRFPASYLADRRQALQRFRAANQAQLTRWMPDSGGKWSAFYGAARRHRLLLALPLLGMLLGVLGLHQLGHHGWLRRHAGDRFGFLFGPLWLLGCVLAAYLLQTALRGSFDMSSVNHRQGFIRFTLALGVLVGLLGPAFHLAVRRSLCAACWDMSILSLLGTLLCLAHPWLLGWHLSFPVPSPGLFFLPYFAALFLPALNGVALLLCLAMLLRSRWLASSSAMQLLEPAP